jgi:hypothetical protein
LVFAADHGRPHRIFHDIGIELGSPVLEVSGLWLPMVEEVVAHFRQGQLMAQAFWQLQDQGTEPLQAAGKVDLAQRGPLGGVDASLIPFAF